MLSFCQAVLSPGVCRIIVSFFRQFYKKNKCFSKLKAVSVFLNNLSLATTAGTVIVVSWR